MPHAPKVKSFVIADQVFQQSDSHKWCLIGVFDRIYSSRFPTRHPSLGIWLKLADAEGDYDIRLEIQDSSGRVLSSLSGLKLTVNDRLAEPEIGIQTHHLPLPAAGMYFIKLYFNERPAESDIRIEVCATEETG